MEGGGGGRKGGGVGHVGYGGNSCKRFQQMLLATEHLPGSIKGFQDSHGAHSRGQRVNYQADSCAKQNQPKGRDYNAEPSSLAACKKQFFYQAHAAATNKRQTG